MKVCFLTTSFPVTQNPISGIFIRHLVDHLSAKAEIVVLTPADCEPDHHVDFASFKIAHVRYAPRRWQTLAHQEGGIPATLSQHWYKYLLVPPFLICMLIATVIRARRCDLIHANWAISGALAGIAGKVLRIPVLTTIRGSDLERAKTKRIDRLILRAAVSTSHLVVTVNPVQKPVLLAVAPRARHKLHTIFNGVGNDFYNIGDYPREHRPLSKILTIGRFVSDKGIDTILKALSITDNPTFELTVIGSGPEEQALMNLAGALNLSSRIHFVGAIGHKDIPKVFGDHDIFVLASHAEGRPNVVVEAIATGTPVVCSNIPGIHDLIEPDVTGRTFTTGDATALAKQLNDAHIYPLRTYEMARKARAQLIEYSLTWEKCASDYMKLYQHLSLNTKKHITHFSDTPK